MDLKPYLTILWRRRWLIVIVIAITLGIVGVGTFITPPVYAANTVLRVAATTGGSLSYTDFVYNDRLLNTYTMLAVSGPVLDEVSQRLGLADRPEVQVQVIVNTELIQVTAESSNPAQARDIANVLSEVLISDSKELYTGGGKSTKDILAGQLAQLETELDQARQDYEQMATKSPQDTEQVAAAAQVVQLKSETYATLLKDYENARLQEAIRANTITIIEPASLPTEPVRPNLLINFGMGGFLSVAAGLGLAFLFNYLDTAVYAAPDVTRMSGLHTMGEIPLVKDGQVTLSGGDNAPLREGFRRLRANLFGRDGTAGPRTLLITGADGQVGASLVTANLAFSLSKTGKTVVVVDGDLDAPTLMQCFGLPEHPGLTDILAGRTSLETAIQHNHHSEVRVVTHGSDDESPGLWQSTPAMRNLLSGLANQFDVVLVDSAPLRVSSDASLLSEMVDGVLVVARTGKTSGEALKQCVTLAPNVLGVVLNQPGKARTR